jgi:hypothetical protein
MAVKRTFVMASAVSASTTRWVTTAVFTLGGSTKSSPECAPSELPWHGRQDESLLELAAACRHVVARLPAHDQGHEQLLVPVLLRTIGPRGFLYGIGSLTSPIGYSQRWDSPLILRARAAWRRRRADRPLGITPQLPHAMQNHLLMRTIRGSGADG